MGVYEWMCKINQNAVDSAVCVCTVLSYLCQIEPHQFYCLIIYLFKVALQLLFIV